jgi:hypothetical protein
VVQLLLDVLREVFGERRRERVVTVRSPRLLERRLGQRDGRANDLVLEDQVFRPKLREARVLEERLVRGSERADDDVDLSPETETCGQ